MSTANAEDLSKRQRTRLESECALAFQESRFGELAKLAAELDRLVAGPTEALPMVDIDAIFAPLPPVPYLVPRLDICPGAPTLIAGSSYVGKTVAGQSAALSFATGGVLWGDFYVARRGPVKHLDYEQGLRLTRERYQRLARAMGLTADDLRGLLSVAALPAFHVSSPNALDVLCRAFDGAAFGLIDSLRACAPDVDENTSDVRRLLDLLTIVSEKTGCVGGVIHHSRKPREDDAGGAKNAIRGSSAIVDACASVLVLSAAKGEPVLVEHEKARTSGITHEDFSLTIEDVEIDGDPRAGLRVRTMALASREERKAEAQQARASELDASVLLFVSKHPGCSQRQVEAALEITGRGSVRREALARLEMAGAIAHQPGANRAKLWSATRAI